MVGVTVRMGIDALKGWPAWLIAVASLALLLRWKISPAWIVLGGGMGRVVVAIRSINKLKNSWRNFMMLQRIACVVLLLTFSVAANAGDRKFIVKPRSGDRKALPFSEAVLVGNTLYIAGHIGLDAKTDLPPASAEDEARLVMDGIKQTVESAGMSMDDVVSMQIFCTDLKLYDTFNAVYKGYFHGDFPARAFIGTDKLLRNGRYEVLGIAVKRSQ
jgi:reactive intermediate/imine deaminase